MKTIQIVNFHRFRGGADVMARMSMDVLTEKGHGPILLSRDSRELATGFSGKARAFFSGMYSGSGRRAVREALSKHRPDLVHVHEVFPLFSPWILRDCARAGVPVVMACHDYRLTCPNAIHLCDHNICESCMGGREYWCLFKNCRENLFESLAYSLRSAIARWGRLFLDNVKVFVTPSEFARGRLIEAGFPADRITTVQYGIAMPDESVDCGSNDNAVYVGRIRPEKGIETLMDAAGAVGLNMLVAGDNIEMPHVKRNAPPCVEFLGVLERDEVNDLYRRARFAVFPSLWYETFGLVAAEAMSHGLPVIASNLGGVVEVVDDGITGLLFEPGNADELAHKMRLLRDNPDMCREMGRAGRRKATEVYSRDAYYERLLAVFGKAVGNGSANG